MEEEESSSDNEEEDDDDEPLDPDLEQVTGRNLATFTALASMYPSDTVHPHQGRNFSLHLTLGRFSP